MYKENRKVTQVSLGMRAELAALFWSVCSVAEKKNMIHAGKL